MYGARISLLVGVASVLLSMLVGVEPRPAVGFRRRQDRRLHHARVRRDAVVPADPDRAADRRRRPRDVPNAHDTLAFAVLIIAIALPGWVQYARTVRGSTLVERNKEYVQAARVIGVTPLRIMRQHVLPNVLGPVLVLATIQVAQAIMIEATLSFLGVGVPPTAPSLGTLIRIGNDFLFSRRMVDHHLPRCDAGADRAEREPARRLAARRAQPALADEPMPPLLGSQEPERRVPHAARHAAGARRHLASTSPPARSSAWSANPGAGKSLTGASIIGLLEPPGASPRGEILLEGQRIDNLAHEPMRRVRGRQIGAIFQDPLTSLDPLYTVGPAAGGDHPDPPADRPAASPRSARSSCCKDTGIPRRRGAYRTLSAPVLRRHAPACGDRAGAGGRTQARSSPTSRPPRSTSRSRRRSSRCSSACAAKRAPR